MTVRIKQILMLAAMVFLTGLTTACGDDKAPAPPVDIDNVEYSAPQVGKPQATVGAGSRCPTTVAPSIFLLAPHQTGASIHAQPNLYWYMDGDTEADIDFVIVPQDMEPSAKPLLKKIYEGHQSAGVHTVSLAQEDVKLQEDQQYKVTVMLHASPDNDHSKNPYSIAYLAIVARPASLRENPDGPALARAGLWYDAIDALIQSKTDDKANVERRQLFGLLWKEHVFLLVPVSSVEQSKSELAAAQKAADRRESDQFKGFAAMIQKPQAKE